MTVGFGEVESRDEKIDLSRAFLYFVQTRHFNFFNL
jgi:hypothetical protein